MLVAKAPFTLCRICFLNRNTCRWDHERMTRLLNHCWQTPQNGNVNGIPAGCWWARTSNGCHHVKTITSWTGLGILPGTTTSPNLQFSSGAIKPIEMGQCRWERNDVIRELRTSCGRERLAPGAPDKKRKRLNTWWKLSTCHLPLFSFPVFSSTLKATRKGNSSVERKEDVRDSRGPRSLTPIRFYTVVFVFVTTGEKILTRTVSRTPVTMEANSDKTAINPAIIFFFFSVGTPVTQSTRFAQRAGHYTVE